MDHVEVSEPRAEHSKQCSDPVAVCSWGLGPGHSGLCRKGIHYLGGLMMSGLRVGGS